MEWKAPPWPPAGGNAPPPQPRAVHGLAADARRPPAGCLLPVVVPPVKDLLGFESENAKLKTPLPSAESVVAGIKQAGK